MRRRLALAFVIIALVGFLAGCGGSGDDGGESSGGDAKTAAPASGTAPPESNTGSDDMPKLRVRWDGLDQPVDVEAPAGDPRIFVVQQDGRILVAPDRDEPLAESPYLDLSRDTEAEGERGLLGLAFHRDFRSNGRLYVNYTNREGDTRVVELTVDPEADAPAAVKSRRELLRLDQPYENHNGGDVVFGPDGRLWVGTGDGGDAGDPQNRAQNPKSLFGKMLRIDVEASDPKPETWAVGLRNPWRYSFDPKTGDLWIGDVGQDEQEEVDVVRKAADQSGLNFGWPAHEGSRRFKGKAIPDAVEPVATYGRDDGGTVAGGYVYRGPANALSGRYVYGDFASGRIWTLDAASPGAPAEITEAVGAEGLAISSFGLDSAGRLYVCDYNGNVLSFG